MNEILEEQLKKRDIIPITLLKIKKEEFEKIFPENETHLSKIYKFLESNLTLLPLYAGGFDSDGNYCFVVGLRSNRMEGRREGFDNPTHLYLKEEVKKDE